MIQLNSILEDRLKEFKDKEEHQLNSIKKEYEDKVKAYREKYKQLEEKEFSYLENEFNKAKVKFNEDFQQNLSNFEFKLRQKADKTQREVRGDFDLFVFVLTFLFYCFLMTGRGFGET